MKIAINDSVKLNDVMRQFHEQFPYLKIEFFSKPHKIADLSRKNYMLLHNKSVGECRDIHQEGIIEATGHEKVWELEQEFQKLGLPAQVFRLMGNNWIETIQTDWWTIDEQNEKGREFSMSEYPELFHHEMDDQEYHNV